MSPITVLIIKIQWLNVTHISVNHQNSMAKEMVNIVTCNLGTCQSLPTIMVFFGAAPLITFLFFAPQNVAIELVVGFEDIPGSQCENIFLANDTNHLPFSTSSIERLKSGLEDYILKHGHRSTQSCKSCFSTW